MNSKNIKFFIQYFLVGSNMFLYRKFLLNFAKHKHLFVNKSIDIVIEGYPRCGNTFAVAAFKYAQEKKGLKVKIARHRHEIGQVLLAVKYKIPTLVLIREPLDAVSSLIIREKISPQLAIRYYIYYYQHLIKVRENIVVGEFNKVISNYGEIIKELNRNYNRNFAIFEHTPETIKKVKAIIGEMELEDSGGQKIRITHVAIPTKERKKMKQEIKRYLKNSKKLMEFLNQAQYIYKKFLG